MRTSLTVKGLDAAMAAMWQNAIVNRANARRGLMKAGLFVQGDAVRKAPIDTGNLRATAYTEDVTIKVPTVEVGFTADYAIFVHEIQKNYVVGDWKYLQRAVDENQLTIKALIASEM